MANQSYHLLLKMTPPSHRRRWRIALALILVTVEVVSTAELSYVSNGGTSGFYKECEGDCDNDSDCQGTLVCYQSSEGGNEVPGCSGQTSGGIDYCFTPTLHTGNLPLTFIGDELSAYGECQGDCDSDSECPTGMFCFQRGSGGASNSARIPGCDGTGVRGEDYCHRPVSSTPSPTTDPSAAPTMPPVACTINDDCNDLVACNGVEVCISGVCQPGAPSCDPQSSQPHCIENYPSHACVACISPDHCIDESPCLPNACHGDGHCYTTNACAADETCVIIDPNSFQCNPITNSPSQRPSSSPTSSPTSGSAELQLKYVWDNNGGNCTMVPGYDPSTGACPESIPLGQCSGDCDGDNQCAKGLVCLQRNSGDEVPGCGGTPLASKDYCVLPEANQLVYVFDNSASDSVNTTILQACQGDCDSNSDCADGLLCGQRSGNEPLFGCAGGGISGKDYCHVPPPMTDPPTRAPTPVCLEFGEDCSQSAESECCSGVCIDGRTCGEATFPELTYVSNGETNGFYKECEGDCDNDSDCQGTLVCYQSELSDGIVPGCSGKTSGTIDYCFTPTLHTGNLPLTFIGDELSAYGECQGDCDSDSECPTGMFCFQRGTTHPSSALVPNCDGTGIPGEDYCHRIVAGPIESTHVPTATPTMCPESPEVTTSPTGPVSYRPGEKTTSSDDGYVALSTGLVAKAIAIAGSPVNLVGGSQSAENFHTRPDGAAVFPDECGGWAYVSNSEEGSSSVDTGGVGAIYFNAMGEVTGYKMIQKNTRRNCSGGKTWWGSWVTCEECGSTGGVFEVHPKGHPNGDATLKRKTLLGRRNGRSGGNYEGVAYYNPAPTDSNIRPAFYLTEDATSGPLERFRPSNAVLAESIATNDFYKLLHDDPDGTATTDYLNLITWETDDNHLSHYGTFDWSPDYTVGTSNANSYFQKCEGIDVRNGMLYMTCKTNKQFFILDLEAGTYVESHTDGRTTDINGNDISISGPFTGQPDQIRAILNGTDDQLVYFCEDVGDKAGIHAKDSTGQFYTIAQDEGGFHSGETTGLAFSPDNRHMYVAYQSKGIIYDITRADGRAFGGATLAIQYHGMNTGNDFINRFLRKRRSE